MFNRKADNILVIKTDGLAGFIAAEPLFEKIRAANDGAVISLLTTNELQRVARASPYFDRVAAAPPATEPEARKAFFRQLKNEKFAKVYDLARDDAAKKLQSVLGPFGPKWFGVPSTFKKRNAAGASYDDGPEFEKFIRASGIEPPERLPDLSWALSARKDSANMQPSWFGVSGAFGLLMPTLDDTRRWPAANYADFARLIAREGIMPVLVGGKELHNFGDEVAHSAPEIVDLSGKTDHLQLAALAQQASFFVSDDAEEVHLALSSGCSGILIKKSKEQDASPEGRDLVTLTVDNDLGEVRAEFIWRTLDNMCLLPAVQSPQQAAAH